MKENLKVKILVGLPGSGKSTWAKNFIAKNDNYVRVNRDDFRLMLKNSQICENHIEKLISELVKTTVIKSLVANQNVIIDNTHLKAKYINETIEYVKEYADIEYIVFDTSLEKCIEQDKLRDKQVGELIIRKMYKDYLILKDSFIFQNVKREIVSFKTKQNYQKDLEEAVIFDIDGTLSYIGNRGIYDLDKLDRDYFNDIVGEHIQFHKSKNRKIIILSGREELCLDATKEFFNFYNIEYDYIYMRKNNDMRKDSVVKKEIYLDKIKDKYNILCVYDDRHQVLDMWYKLGIFTFNVNQGNKEF